MQLKKITMQAFGPYLVKHSLDFQGQFNNPLILFGPGGSGKTALIKAVLFALFGLPGLKSQYSSIEYPEATSASFLLLDRGLDQLDQQTVEQLIAGISKHDHHGHQLIFTSTRPQF